MKLICTQLNFKKAINNCERVVGKRNTLPILNNLMLETERGGLKVSATNLEIGVSAKIGAKIEKSGKFTVPSRLISAFSANLPSGENVNIELSGDNLKIKSGFNKTIIKGIPAHDFPLLPSKKTENLLILSGLELKTALMKIMPAVAINEARQELTGINVIFQEKELLFAATDSFRLAEYKIKLDETKINRDNYNALMQNKENIIIPSATLAELNRIILADEESEVKIAIEDGQIFFETDGIKVVSRLLNGKYPEYKHIMPKDYKTRAVGSRSLLQGAIKLANIFSSGGSSEITLKIDQEAGKLIILASSAEAGENSTELKFDIKGPSQGIVFNAKYLLDGINASATSQVALLSNSESSPVAVKEVDEKSGKILDDYIYIVMPIKN